MKPVPLAHLRVAGEGAVAAKINTVVIGAAGPDAAAFLHGQLANDVTGLPVGGVNVSLHLNHKGHAVADGTVVRRDKNDLLYVVEDPVRGHDARPGVQVLGHAEPPQPVAQSPAEWVFESLSSHIIFDDVELSRLDLAVITLQGMGAAAFLTEVPEPGKIVAQPVSGFSALAYARSRCEYGGFDLLVTAADSAAVLAGLIAAGAVEVDQATLNALRVIGGIPTAAGEGGEGVLPQEAELEFALSYRKGCYLGQEIMARIEARGNLRRSLRRLELSAVPTPGSARELLQGNRTVGLLGTVAAIPANDGASAGPSVQALAVARSDLPVGAKLLVGDVEATVLV